MGTPATWVLQEELHTLPRLANGLETLGGIGSTVHQVRSAVGAVNAGACPRLGDLAENIVHKEQRSNGGMGIPGAIWVVEQCELAVGTLRLLMCCRG
jgi:hypothetical protein